MNGPPGVASDLDRGGDDDVEISAAVMMMEMEMEMALAPVDWRWFVYLCALFQRLNSTPLGQATPMLAHAHISWFMPKMVVGSHTNSALEITPFG